MNIHWGAQKSLSTGGTADVLPFAAHDDLCHLTSTRLAINSGLFFVKRTTWSLTRKDCYHKGVGFKMNKPFAIQAVCVLGVLVVID